MPNSETTSLTSARRAQSGSLAVYSRPARDTTNPYTAMLADALELQGLTVREVGMSRSDLPFSSGVLLIHWPNELYRTPKDLKILIAAWLKLVRIAFAKQAKGLKLVWVAHNITPHEDTPESPPLRWKWFLRLVDGVIALSGDSMNEVLDAYPQLRSKARLVTTHGHYLDQAITSPAMPPQIGNRPVRLAAPGSIRANKGFVELATAVAQNAGDLDLSIRGAASNAETVEELRKIAAVSPQVRVEIGRMTDAEFEAEVDAADLVVLPYTDILNSGVLFYALSRFRPVLAPRKGSIPEVQSQVGSNWIYLFDGEFGSQVLEDAFRWLKSTSREKPPSLDEQDWKLIGSNVAHFLRLVAQSRD